MTPCPAKRMFLVALLGAGCNAKKPDASQLPGPDGSAAGDGTPGLAADQAPGSQAMAFTQFLDEQFKVWSARWVACFNSPLEVLSPGGSPLYDDTPDHHAYSLEQGLVVMDQAKARACLDALRTVSCEGLASEAYRGVCTEVLVGQVASGGFCDWPQDCRSPGDSCTRTEMYGCHSRCTPEPRLAMGEACGGEQRCVAGTSCQPMTGTAESRCQPLRAEGASCPDGASCAPGTWCQPFAYGAHQGTCRSFQAGLACQGWWQCPYAHACLIPDGATAGTCQPGRKKGEPCALQGKELLGGPVSDCAKGLFCYPGAGDQLRCGAGYELGEACPELDVGAMNPLSIPCRVGACRPDATGKRLCQPDQKAGDPCGNDRACGAGLACSGGKCVDMVVAVGQRCTGDGTFTCGPGARCAISPMSPSEGTCVPFKKVGETCTDSVECEGRVACVGGICVRCK